MTREKREIENRIERLQNELCYDEHDESGKLELRGKINDAREALAQARRDANRQTRDTTMNRPLPTAYGAYAAAKRRAESKAPQCADCRDGEHDNYDDELKLVIIRDPDMPGRMVKRAYLCEHHREMYAEDGYAVVSAEA